MCEILNAIGGIVRMRDYNRHHKPFYWVISRVYVTDLVPSLKEVGWCLE